VVTFSGINQRLTIYILRFTYKYCRTKSSMGRPSIRQVTPQEEWLGSFRCSGARRMGCMQLRAERFEAGGMEHPVEMAGGALRHSGARALRTNPESRNRTPLLDSGSAPKSARPGMTKQMRTPTGQRLAPASCCTCAHAMLAKPRFYAAGTSRAGRKSKSRLNSKDLGR
jgi:hypothetical protein